MRYVKKILTAVVISVDWLLMVLSDRVRGTTIGDSVAKQGNDDMANRTRPKGR